MMERLTKRLPDNLGCVPVEGIGWPELAERLAAYEDMGLTPETCKDIKSLCDDYVDAGLDASLILACIAAARAGVSSKRMTEISKAESDNRLIVLPCKVGDTVWVVDRGEILKETVLGFNTFKKNDGKIVTAMTTTYRDFLTQPTITDFGKLMPDNRLSFFVTREEAEEALRRAE